MTLIEVTLRSRVTCTRVTRDHRHTVPWSPLATCTPREVGSGLMSPLLIDTERVSELTGVPVETLKYWRRIGKGPRWSRIERRVVYRPSDVNEWVESFFPAPAATGSEG